ncbi:MAG: hypothetical protein ACODAD_01110 [Planctomycetota bacterium]
MASRENQGLHIALILLVMLTVGLCVVSFVFFSKSQRLSGEAEEARDRMQAAQDDYEKANFKVQTLTYMITGQGKSWDEISEDLANIPGSGDEELAAIRRTYRDNMMLFGPAEEELEQARNYENLPNYLLATIRDLNQQVADLRRTENQLTQEKANVKEAADEQIEDAEEARNQARQDLAMQSEEFAEDLEAVREKWEQCETEKTDKDGQIAELNTQLEEARTALNNRIEELGGIVDDQRNKIKGMETTSFESPDAVVTTVNQRGRVLYIDVGAEDNLKPQQTFSVFDKGTTGIMDAQPKGRIEVHRVLGAHAAMCHILEDEVSNIIAPGDLVFTPAWSPGKNIHFAICGYIDITEGRGNDADLLAKLIKLNGGVIDDEITVQTRYLIQGERSVGEQTDRDVAGDLQQDFDEKLETAIEIGVDRLSPEKLLTLMGWEADVTTVTLGSGEAAEVLEESEPEESTDEPEESTEDEEASPFRKRTPSRGSEGAF